MPKRPGADESQLRPGAKTNQTKATSRLLFTSVEAPRPDRRQPRKKPRFVIEANTHTTKSQDNKRGEDGGERARKGANNEGNEKTKNNEIHKREEEDARKKDKEDERSCTM